MAFAVRQGDLEVVHGFEDGQVVDLCCLGCRLVEVLCSQDDLVVARAFLERWRLFFVGHSETFAAFFGSRQGPCSVVDLMVVCFLLEEVHAGFEL